MRLDRSEYYSGLGHALAARFGVAMSDILLTAIEDEAGDIRSREREMNNELAELVLPAVAVWRVLCSMRGEAVARSFIEDYGYLRMESAAGVRGMIAKMPGVSSMMRRSLGKTLERASSKSEYGRRKFECSSYGITMELTACPVYEACRKLDAPQAAKLVCGMETAKVDSIDGASVELKRSPVNDDDCCEIRVRYHG